MLLRRRFDNDPSLRAQLLTAFLGGIAYHYTASNSFTGGALENIPLCGDSAQCGCIHAWRSYQDGQILEVDNSNSSLTNPLFVPGYLYSAYDTTQHIVRQDSLIYPSGGRTHSRLLRPPNAYGSTAYAIAYDALYDARYERQNDQQVGLMLEYAPAAYDQRPDYLAERYAGRANFARQGYHAGDFWVYGWDALQLTQAKLDGGCSISSRSDDEPSQPIAFWYDSRRHALVFNSPQHQTKISMFNSIGQKIIVESANGERRKSLPPLPGGLYIVNAANRWRRIIVH